MDGRPKGRLLSGIACLQEACCQGWHVYRRVAVRDKMSIGALLSGMACLQEGCCQG